MNNTANWYRDLLEIDKLSKIIGICVSGKDRETRLFNSVKDAKEILDYEFDDGYGGTEGPSFTAWSENYVYFPACYDGSEWIATVPRNPINIATEHIGGG